MSEHTLQSVLDESTDAGADPATLMPKVYAELRRMAANALRRERFDHTLQPTALVHEAFLKLADQNADWQSPAHFVAVGAEAMRRILVDHARRKKADKRGGWAVRRSLSVAWDLQSSTTCELDDLDDALKKLAALSERQAKIVELRFFGGLSLDEVGDVLGVSRATIKNDWRVARAWLQHELSGGEA